MPVENNDVLGFVARTYGVQTQKKQQVHTSQPTKTPVTKVKVSEWSRQATPKYGCVRPSKIVRVLPAPMTTKYASPSCRPLNPVRVVPAPMTTKYASPSCRPQNPVVIPDRRVVTRYACPTCRPQQKTTVVVQRDSGMVTRYACRPMGSGRSSRG